MTNSTVYVPRVSHSSLTSLFFFGTPKIKWHSLQSQVLCRLIFLDVWAGELDVGLRTPSPVGETSAQ